MIFHSGYSIFIHITTHNHQLAIVHFQLPVEQWFNVKIVVTSDEVQVFVNDKLVNRVTEKLSNVIPHIGIGRTGDYDRQYLIFRNVKMEIHKY